MLKVCQIFGIKEQETVTFIYEYIKIASYKFPLQEGGGCSYKIHHLPWTAIFFTHFFRHAN